MPNVSQAGDLLRLISEMQMLLYTHPLNDAREARGALPINAIWFNGSGILPTPPVPENNPQTTRGLSPAPAMADPGSKSGAGPICNTVRPTVVSTLRQAALQEDWATWATAWQALDASEIKEMLAARMRGESVQLTLCGERHAQAWLTQPQALVQKIKGFFSTQPIQNVLEKL
jgi:hypothetical protein